MATNIRIINAHDCIRATPDGRLDLEMSKKGLAELALAAGALTDYEILMDTRRAQVVMSVTDLWYLATEIIRLPAELGDARGPFPRKTAVLCPLEEFDHAGFFALCAQNRGLNLRAFTSFEDAIEWLIAPGT